MSLCGWGGSSVWAYFFLPLDSKRYLPAKRCTWSSTEVANAVGLEIETNFLVDNIYSSSIISTRYDRIWTNDNKKRETRQNTKVSNLFEIEPIYLKNSIITWRMVNYTKEFFWVIIQTTIRDPSHSNQSDEEWIKICFD